MELPEIVKQTYQLMVERLTTRFIPGGYQIVHQQHDDLVFGSCYTIWSNNQDALRLTWDGKESWFILEEADLPISAATPWTEIIISPFDIEKPDPVYANVIIQDILDSLD
jgi:hypothetical protein